MAPALVTGASGFVGWQVARALLEAGQPVRALVRAGSHVPELDVERVTGDLRDAASVERAVAGCRYVYHVAADYRLWARNESELFESNVEGTKNLLKASAAAGVDRVVYTSTVGCIGVPKDRPGAETDPVSLRDMAGAYKRSKFLAEQAALQMAARGAPVVIVNPTAPVGDHDFKPTPTGKIVIDFMAGRMPAYIDTGLNLVDVRDVAQGHLLACEKGRVGERYILGHRNMRLKEILETLGRVSGKPAPRLRLPYAFAYGAGLASTGWASISGKPPRVPIDAVRMARKHMFVSTEKARKELGFRPGPVEDALVRAIDWFRANRYF